jgi:2-polyprenyl-3-methyl-5-hydroxy-6-metoxy-1,4-benzoquinol methylase
MLEADASDKSDSAGSYTEWDYADAPWCSHAYLVSEIFALCPRLEKGTRVLDVGCGNGAMAGEFLQHGCDVVGIDLSRSGIEVARKKFPRGRFEIQAADDRLLSRLGEAPFDVVISTEVIEHLYDPRSYATGCFRALKPGGRFICSTPYHGYLKNLALSIFNKWDFHADPLFDGGHIKLFSRATLGRLLVDSGFENIRFRGAGRVPFLWKSMIMSGDKIGSASEAAPSGDA